MRKKLIFLLLIILIVLFIILSNEINDSDIPTQVIVDKNSVSYNGWLYTSGSMIMNKNNEEIQLKGLSSHGIQWFSDVITYDNLKTLKDDWNINVFRIAMYTDPNSLGYISNPEELKQRVYEIADWAIDLDIYVIIDWHILQDNNPQYYKEDALTFFDEVSKKYADTPNVIYEICNEPNGDDVTWDNDIKPYAEEVISVIRNNCPDSLIIVGTPDWCKKLDDVSKNPLEFKNVVYSFHFYSGSHNIGLRKIIDNCLDKDIPIFVSECGLTDASGDGELYLEEFNTWINYLDSKNISWIYWSFSNKNESSAIISSDYIPYIEQNDLDESYDNTSELSYSSSNLSDFSDSLSDSPNLNIVYVDFSDYLTVAGKYVYDLLIK